MTREQMAAWLGWPVDHPWLDPPQGAYVPPTGVDGVMRFTLGAPDEDGKVLALSIPACSPQGEKE